jgi:hypothetical protein
MPLTLRLHFTGPQSPGPFRHADGLRALAYRWIAATDPALADAIHETNAPKPLTLSPLSWEAGHAWVDVTLLAESLADAVAPALASVPPEVRLGQDRYLLQRVEPVARASWEELLEPPAHLLRSVSLRLLTPTASHASGTLRKALPLPDPAIYYGAWARRWNAAIPWCGPDAPPPAPADMTTLADERVAISYLHGGTCEAMMGDRDRRFIGFVGTVRFAVLDPAALGVDEQRWLATLSRFATYCGTGVETLRGMGQTELTEPV